MVQLKRRLAEFIRSERGDNSQKKKERGQIYLVDTISRIESKKSNLSPLLPFISILVNCLHEAHSELNKLALQ